MFDLVEDDDAPIAGGDFEYFAHFRESGSFQLPLRRRISVVEANTPGGGLLAWNCSFCWIS